MTQTTGTQSLLAAVHFAAEKHRTQRRKYSADTPYVNHPIAVAALLAEVSGITDLVTLQAAVLHDTIEDTDATPGDLEERFGQETCHVVQELTDDKRLPKAERKRLQIDRAPTLSVPAKLIRIADKICNLKDVLQADPKNWPPDKKREYLQWAIQVVAGCRGVNPPLEALFDSVATA